MWQTMAQTERTTLVENHQLVQSALFFSKTGLACQKTAALYLKLASQSFKVFSVPLSVRSVITHEKHALGIEPMTMLIPISGQPAVLAGIS